MSIDDRLACDYRYTSHEGQYKRKCSGFFRALFAVNEVRLEKSLKAFLLNTME